MIGLEDRQTLAQDIRTAHSAGARLHLACEIAGIDTRTLQRWKAHAGLVCGDGRPHAVRPTPAHALKPDERAALLSVANGPRFAAVSPARESAQAGAPARHAHCHGAAAGVVLGHSTS